VLTALVFDGNIDKHREWTTYRTAGKCEILAEEAGGDITEFDKCETF
jgi:hypothetical protein